MARTKSEQQVANQMTSIDQWMNHFGLKAIRDKEYAAIEADPDRLATALANSTFDRLLRKKGRADASGQHS